MTNGTAVKASQQLYNEVITRGLCTLCGACVLLCPYFRINRRRGTVQRIDSCERDEGRCYQYCPRTDTDMDAIYQRVFGIPLDTDKVGIGVVRDAFLARSTDADVLKRGQDGGVVTTLLWAAMQEGIIDGAVETKMSDDKSPHGFLARNREELLQCAGNSYEPSASLEVLNHIPEDSNEKVAVVGLPCQVAAVSNMKTYPAKNGMNIDNVKLVIGLFCGWSLSPGSLHQFLQEKLDLSDVVKFDIPHHPAHTLDVYTTSGKKSFELDEIREFINPACSYCCDMTSQFADISVGSGRAMFRGWNTVIVRTETGADLVERAKRKDLLETQPIPAESLTHLKKATLNKIKRAIKNIVELTGSEQDLGYIKVKPELLEALLKGITKETNKRLLIQ